MTMMTHWQHTQKSSVHSMTPYRKPIIMPAGPRPAGPTNSTCTNVCKSQVAHLLVFRTTQPWSKRRIELAKHSAEDKGKPGTCQSMGYETSQVRCLLVLNLLTMCAIQTPMQKQPAGVKPAGQNIPFSKENANMTDKSMRL